jgi:hypothetical protein
LTNNLRNFKISLLNNAAILNLNNIQNSLQFYLVIERSLATKAFVVVVGVTNCEFVCGLPVTSKFPKLLQG